MNISDVSENMNAGSLILKGIRKVASEDGNGRVKSEDTNPLERDVKNEDSSRDDIDFADTAYQDFYPYLEVEPHKYRFRVLNASNSRFIFW